MATLREELGPSPGVKKITPRKNGKTRIEWNDGEYRVLDLGRFKSPSRKAR